MSFNRLLKDASAEAKADYSPLRRRGEDKGCDDAKGEAKALDATAMAELVNLVSEYLFDLFDANLMEEFKALERFEIDCMDHFDPEAEESGTGARLPTNRAVTGRAQVHVQAGGASPRVRRDDGGLRREVHPLPRLRPGPVLRGGPGADGRHESGRRRRAARRRDARRARARDGSGAAQARECMEVLFEMADIEVWVTGMRARVRYRRQHAEGPKLAPPAPSSAAKVDDGWRLS